MPLIAISSDNFDDFKADKYIKKKSNKQKISITGPTKTQTINTRIIPA